jgi:hypothetical protein
MATVTNMPTAMSIAVAMCMIVDWPVIGLTIVPMPPIMPASVPTTIEYQNLFGFLVAVFSAAFFIFEKNFTFSSLVLLVIDGLF